MKLCTETITVFNVGMDADKGYEVYYPTIIRGVSWYCEIASTVNDSGLKAANKFTIRIPEDADFSGKSYVDPVEYASADSDSVFTLRNGDIIVKAAASGSGLTPPVLQQTYGEIVTVLGVTDNRRAPKEPHWKLVGA